MIKIFTVYFEGKYRPDYVTKLYHSLKRNCKVPFEFICLSDTKEVEADRVIMLPKWSDIKIHWHKLKFFSPLFGGQQRGDEIIVMDIDQIIVGDITDMINYPVEENELVSYRKWWKKGNPNSGNTVALNGGKNAGILAAQVIGCSDKCILDKIQLYKEGLKIKVQKASENLKS